jgi:hypothetical protein
MVHLRSQPRRLPHLQLSFLLRFGELPYAQI